MMKAYVTSIGESTTALCVEALERNGFDVMLIENGSLLSDKLKTIYEFADDDFVRVDADVVVNNQFTPKFVEGSKILRVWWIQYMTFSWFKQDLTHGGAQFILKEALPALRKHVDEYHAHDRPETMLSRISEFHSPRRFDTDSRCVGIHGFAANDIERVRQQKLRRAYFDTYDFEMAAKLEDLL